MPNNLAVEIAGRRALIMRAALALSLACGVTITASAQNRRQVVKARTALASTAAYAGKTVKVAVVAEIDPGFHINDHKPTLDYLIPTEVQFDTLPNFKVEKLVYPKGELKTFAFSDTALSVYQGTLTVGALVKVASAVKPGTYTFKGKLRYQACNDQACLPPASVPLELAIEIVPRNQSVKPANAELFMQIKFE